MRSNITYCFKQMNVLNFIRFIKLHLQKLIYLDTPTRAPAKVFGMTFVKNVFLSLLLTTKKVDQPSVWWPLSPLNRHSGTAARRERNNILTSSDVLRGSTYVAFIFCNPESDDKAQKGYLYGTGDENNEKS